MINETERAEIERIERRLEGRHRADMADMVDDAKFLIALLKRDREVADEAAERLVCAMHIYPYPNYRIDSRGQRGCIADALEKIAPDVLKEVQETSWDAVYNRRWAEEEEA
jgi:hypothetical protein